MEQINSPKKWGIGSFAMGLSIVSIIISFSYIGEKNIGEYILGAMGIESSVAIISLILFVMAAFIGYKYEEYYLAKAGRVVAIGFSILICILSIISVN